MRLLLIAAAGALALYLIALAVAWRYQERLVWQPPQGAAPPADSHVRRFEYTASDGQRLFAYLVGDVARAPGLLIACHGNADLAAWLVPWAQAVARRTGWAVLVPEYRGYADLPGTPDYEGSRRDALATYALAATELGVPPARIAIYGHSLGSAVATEMAVAHPPAALLLESPFTSARDMARARLLLPVSGLWGLIARVHFDTRARVAALDAPVWVAHGDRDMIIPVQMGRAVFDAARRKGELLVVRGAGHNDVPEVAGDAYWAWLARALSPAAGGARQSAAPAH